MPPRVSARRCANATSPTATTSAPSSSGDGRLRRALTLTKQQLLGILAGKGLDGIDVSGDPGVLQRLLGLLDDPDPNFPIVTP
ncbi:alkyl sulfatase C-terminal domain-containing protein [Nocardia neocaledoniensis]|uniref:alkyl sulfatase C-terminal domain-containing protein n=1 Tax=Nocardia neocaledoniensis TaxID=236511 RepID=UPI00313D7197